MSRSRPSRYVEIVRREKSCLKSGLNNQVSCPSSATSSLLKNPTLPPHKAIDSLKKHIRAYQPKLKDIGEGVIANCSGITHYAFPNCQIWCSTKCDHWHEHFVLRGFLGILTSHGVDVFWPLVVVRNNQVAGDWRRYVRLSQAELPLLAITCITPPVSRHVVIPDCGPRL